MVAVIEEASNYWSTGYDITETGQPADLRHIVPEWCHALEERSSTDRQGDSRQVMTLQRIAPVKPAMGSQRNYNPEIPTLGAWGDGNHPKQTAQHMICQEPCQAKCGEVNKRCWALSRVTQGPYMACLINERESEKKRAFFSAWLPNLVQHT